MDSLLPDMGEDTPERYEPGTLQTPAIAGLRAGMEYVEAIGLEAICDKEARLGRRLREELGTLQQVRVYAPEQEGGVVLFSVKGYASEDVGRLLDRAGICVRPGFHCSALGHNTLKTPETGAVRVSFGWQSGEGDPERVVSEIKHL